MKRIVVLFSRLTPCRPSMLRAWPVSGCGEGVHDARAVLEGAGLEGAVARLWTDADLSPSVQANKVADIASSAGVPSLTGSRGGVNR
jgi:hypothetical protein